MSPGKPHYRTHVTRSNPSAGFTLVEMAMVIVIIGLVMMTVFPALNTVRMASERATTTSNLHSLMLATAAYVQANGCLPCPANAGASSTSFGRLGYASTTAACGVCKLPEGIAPFAALGIPMSTARDGWGHWITMRVDPALTMTFNVTPPTAVCVSPQKDALNNTCTPGIANVGLCTANLSSKNTYAMVAIPGGATQKAAVLFVSHGTNGYGSFFAQPALSANNGYTLPFTSNYADCSASGGYARCNGACSALEDYPQCKAAQIRQFYDAPLMTGDTDPYDDILAYADRNTLVSLLGNGSCQTVW